MGLTAIRPGWFGEGTASNIGRKRSTSMKGRVKAHECAHTRRTLTRTETANTPPVSKHHDFESGWIRIITISLAVLRSQQSHEWLRMKESRCTCAFLLPDFNEGQPCASYLHEIIEKRHKYNNKLQDWNVILSSGKLADIRLPDVPTRPTLAMQNWFSTESSIPVSQNSAMTLTHPVKPYLVTNYGSVLLPLYKNKKWPVRR